MPIRQLVMMLNGSMTPNVMEGLVDMNGHYILSAKKWKNKVYLRINAINY